MRSETNEIKTDFIFCAILMVMSVIVYSSALSNGFQLGWDDDLYVTKNLDIQNLSIDNIKRIFSSYYVGNYAPLHVLSYMLDYYLWKDNAFGYVLHNIVLCGMNGVMLYFVFHCFGFGRFVSFFASLLFVVHPVQVESVVWISQRKNLLAMFFFLISILTYIKSSDDKSTFSKYMLLSSVSYCFALLSKSVVVVLPVILVFYDVLMRDTFSAKKVIINKLPYIIMAVIGVWLTFASHSSKIAGGMIETFHGGTPYATLLTMITVLKDYFFNVLFPYKLSAYYDPGIKYSFDQEVGYSLAIIAAMLFSPLFFKKNKRWKLLFFLSYIVICILPVSQVTPIVTLMNDRYMYFPMVGVCGIVAVLLNDSSWFGSRLLTLLWFLPLIALGLMSFDRAKAWSSPLALWRDASEKQVHSAFVWYRLGLAYDDSGSRRDAAEAYRRALEINSFRLDAAYNAGKAHVALGEYSLAQEYFEHVFRLNPGDGNNTLMLAHNYYFQDKYDLARTYYLKIWTSNPSDPEVLNYLSNIESAAGNDRLADQYWAGSVAQGGVKTELYLERARLESLKHEEAKSLMALRMAVQNGADPGQILSDPDLGFVRGLKSFEWIMGQGGQSL